MFKVGVGSLKRYCVYNVNGYFILKFHKHFTVIC